MEFHDDKPYVNHVVKTVTEVSCCLSVVGSLLIIITYCIWHDLRTKARRIVVFLSIADLVSALGYLYGSLRAFKSNSWDCVAQGAVSTYSNIASFLWTISVAIYIYMLIVKLDQEYGGSSLIGFHIFNWGIPLVIVIAALSCGGLGWDQSYVSVGWCWVNLNNERFLLWMLLAGKLWEMAAYVILPVIYILIKIHIYQKCQRYPNLTVSQQSTVGTMLRVDLKLTLIPLVFVLLRIWSTARFILYLMESPHVRDTWLICLHGIGNTFQGAANCILFCFLTEKVRRRLCECLCCCLPCCFSREVPVDMGEEDIWHERSGLLAR